MALSQLVEVQGLANNERGSGGGNIAMFALQAGLKQVGVPQSWMVSAIAENPSPFQLVSGGSSCFARQFCFWPLLLSLLAEGAIGFPKKQPPVCARHIWKVLLGLGLGLGLGCAGHGSAASSRHWGCPPQHQLFGQVGISRVSLFSFFLLLSHLIKARSVFLPPALVPGQV